MAREFLYFDPALFYDLVSDFKITVIEDESKCSPKLLMSAANRTGGELWLIVDWPAEIPLETTGSG